MGVQIHSAHPQTPYFTEALEKSTHSAVTDEHQHTKSHPTVTCLYRTNPLPHPQPNSHITFSTISPEVIWH